MRKPLLPAAALLLFASSCATYQAQQGRQAMGLLAYAKAEKHFDKALLQRPDRDVMLLAAETDVKLNKVDEAAAHYAAAAQIAPLTGDAAFQYGRLLMAQGKYGQAEPLLVQSLQDSPERSDVAELIGACQGYRSFWIDSARYRVRPLPMNGVAAAYSPTPYGQGLLFTGVRDANLGKRDPWSGQTFADLYTAQLDSAGNAGHPVPLKGSVQGPFHEGPAVTDNDGRTLYFTRSNYYGSKLHKDPNNLSNLKLFRATLQENGEWGNINEFGFNREDFSVGQPALSADGKTLYFTSDMPGGLGGKDLWYCTNHGTGWEAPVNMGPTINTSRDEMFPTVAGASFYFSSTGHNNMGGLDIFETHPEGEHWSEPRNMGYPVNSTHDDFGLWIDSTGTTGYLSSSRSGADMLYAFSVQPAVITVEGIITNASNGKPVPFALVTLHNLADLMNQQATADADGHFRFNLDPNRAYSVYAKADSMLAQSTMLGTSGLAMNTTLRADMQLKPMERNKPIAVPNIYYDYDKWDIRPDAALELDKLARTFKDNPDLTFELGSHTDSRGGDLYNLVLSDARAKSAVDYLERQGVPPEQVVAKGYGESMPVNQCHDGVKCTEEQHQENRRTEIKVLAGQATLVP